MKREENRGIMTLGEARECGIAYDDPSPCVCEYCGKELEPLGIVFHGRLRLVSAAKCDCEESAEAERLAAEQKAKEARLEELRHLESCGVRRRFLGATITHRESNLFLARFGEDPGCGLYIYGGVGRGKTFEASALAKEFVAAGYSVVFATVPDMLSSIQETYGNNDSTMARMARYTTCDVLVLDDMGKESPSQWAVGMLFQIINARYENLKSMVLTSQFALADLETRMAKHGENESAEAIASRIAETCSALHLVGPDRRVR